jgi:hypothetical protein
MHPASNTFVPHFDITLPESKRSDLVEVSMSSLIVDRVKNE